MERRRFIRVPFRTPVTVISQRLRTKAETENLSIKGTYVRTAEAMDPNERVWLRLTLSGEEQGYLMVSGMVVRQDEGGIGIEFGPMHIGTFLALKGVVADILGDEERVMDELFRFVENGSNDAEQASSESGTPSQDPGDSPPTDEGGPEAA